MEKLSAESFPSALPKIVEIRGQRVLLDSDLAALYGVSTKRLNEQVRRNAERFPHDFLLEFSNQEVAALRSQFATLKTGRGAHRKYPPMAFTEHGAIMAAISIVREPHGHREVQAAVGPSAFCGTHRASAPPPNCFP